MPQYKLLTTNLDFRSRAEPIRFILSYAGKEFEDVRIEDGPAWESLTKKQPLGKAPVLEVDGVVYSDSIAVCRYIATECGVVGDTPQENLRIDQIIGSLCDCKAEIKVLAAAGKLIEVKEVMLIYFERLEKEAQENGGYLANKKFSWADIYFTYFIEQVTKPKVLESNRHPNLLALIEKVRSQPGIQSWIKQRPSEV